MVGDNGPDMCPKNYINIMYFGRIWRDLSLTRFSCVTYPAGRSAYNPIEHAWSPLSNALTAVTISACLPDEDQPPCKQNLSQSDKDEKTAKMLENAASTLAAHWENLTYDSHPVIPIVMRNGDAEKESYCDHDIVEMLMYASKTALDNGSKDLKQARKEFSFYCSHIDRRPNSLSLMKCQMFKPKGLECDWCKSHPPKECEAFDFEKKLGGFFFEPSQSNNHPGHFSTYLEMKHSGKKYVRSKHEHGRCSVCPNWWFSSPTETQRHRRIVHPNVPLKQMIVDDLEIAKPAPAPKLHFCRYKVNGKPCDLSFPSYHQLFTHKNKMGHKADRKRKAKDTAANEAVAEQKRKTGQKKIKEIFSNRQPMEKKTKCDDADNDDVDFGIEIKEQKIVISNSERENTSKNKDEDIQSAKEDKSESERDQDENKSEEGKNENEGEKNPDENESEEDPDENESEEEEYDICAAKEMCRINEDDGDQDNIGWVACKLCEDWWHKFCADVYDARRIFICKNCKTDD